MLRASALEESAQHAGAGDARLAAELAQDRRVTESNRAWLGKVVDGRYRVLDVIGRGGMGVVYRVEHLRMGKIAAMKVLHRELCEDRDAIERFEHEAAAVSRLQHPHTVQVFDFGQAQGALYLIMEYVRGLDLAHILARDGAMPWARAAPLLVQICSALQEAHELGVVHRDLKPENVLVGRTTGGRDFAKVLDFGLAKLDGRQLPSATDRQEIIGTPYFMSPEQIRGDAVDPRSDIYSFGALMFNVLTGENLFTAATAVGVLTKHLTAEPDAPSQRAGHMGLDPRIDHLCKRALAKDPNERWQSAAELSAELEEAYRELVGEATGSGRGGSRPLGGGKLVLDEESSVSDLRLRRSDLDAFERSLRRRRAMVLAGAGATVVGLAAGAAWYLLREGQVVTREHEPNHEQANFIAFDRAVSGLLGKRRNKTEGDLDLFEVKGSAAQQLVSVEVTGIPNLDLVLRVLGKDGRTWVTVDEGGLGEGEHLFRRITEGTMVLAIESLLGEGQAVPTENVSDEYRLLVRREPADPGWEAEPNATNADATLLALGQPVRGRLDSRGDVDVLRWDGEDATVELVVEAQGLPLVWQTQDGQLRPPGTSVLSLRRGEQLRLMRTDQRDRASRKGALPGRLAQWKVTATAKR